MTTVHLYLNSEIKSPMKNEPLVFVIKRCISVIILDLRCMGPRIRKSGDCREYLCILEYQNHYKHTTPAHVLVPISRNLKSL